MGEIAIFKPVDWQTVQNAEILASANELILETSARKVDAYNTLIVQNFDANCDVEIRMDMLNSPSRRFTCQKNGGLVNIGADISMWYQRIFIVNLNTTTACVVSKVTVSGAKVVPHVLKTFGGPETNVPQIAQQLGVTIA